MSQIVWSSHSKDVFEGRWESFISNHGLSGNKWLSDLYADRHLWVPVYLDRHFWVDEKELTRMQNSRKFRHYSEKRLIVWQHVSSVFQVLLSEVLEEISSNRIKHL
ncbi:hypothetical protein PIB30_076974 [Stylosanthes scabra]|uniref:Protein FAR1-RELATED SEQUENCE n=1 Tax=Stylosanthes scabra TaxID=79078 RepID=A0ABU6VQ82_9FABA|nr:hypothetical protein [Stylosanthes scabra]